MRYKINLPSTPPPHSSTFEEETKKVSRFVIARKLIKIAALISEVYNLHTLNRHTRTSSLCIITFPQYFHIATIITQPRCLSSCLVYGNVRWYTHYLFPPCSCCCREFIFPADCVDVFSFFPSVRSKVIILIILHTSNGYFRSIHNLLGEELGSSSNPFCRVISARMINSERGIPQHMFSK